MLMLQQARHGFSLLQISDATGAAFTCYMIILLRYNNNIIKKMLSLFSCILIIQFKFRQDDGYEWYVLQCTNIIHFSMCLLHVISLLGILYIPNSNTNIYHHHHSRAVEQYYHAVSQSGAQSLLSPAVTAANRRAAATTGTSQPRPPASIRRRFPRI